MMARHSLLSFALICALPLALAACGEKTLTDPRTQAPLVRTATIQRSDVESRTFTGTVAARIESDLGFRVSGKVSERLVDTGQSVKRGQPLMRLDPIDLELAARAQQEAVAAARARALQTAEDETRYRGLRGTGAISASAYDQIKAAADAAKAELSAAQAQADVARNSSRYAVLVADGDGIVMDTLAEPGQVVSAGQAVIRLAQAGQREAIIQLPETLRPALGSTGLATRFGQAGNGSTATLRQLSNTADKLTRTFEARYVLQGELADAPLGTTVMIRIAEEQATTQGNLQVPLAALFDAGKGPGVWVIHGEPKTVTWRPVAIQSMSDDTARVTGQIRQGEQIVALGAHLLREGDAVRVAEVAATTAAAGGRP